MGKISGNVGIPPLRYRSGRDDKRKVLSRYMGFLGSIRIVSRFMSYQNDKRRYLFRDIEFIGLTRSTQIFTSKNIDKNQKI